jgi:hypothetical protein
MEVEEDEQFDKHYEKVLRFHNRFKTDPEFIKMLEESKNKHKYYQAIQANKNKKLKTQGTK